jgi:hypothetical protein
VFIGFDWAEGRHPAEANPIFYDPKEFAVGIVLYFNGGQVSRAGVHPTTCVREIVSVEAMTGSAFRPVQFVAFSDARLQIRRRERDALLAGPVNEEVLGSICEHRFDVAWFLQCAELEFMQSHGAGGRDQHEGRNYR